VTDWQRLVRDAVILIVLAVVVLLGASSFFTAWTGTAVSVRPYAEEDAFRRVLLVDDDGHEERWLPAAAVASAELPVDATGIPARTQPEGAPRISKSRFTLHFVVATATGSTTHPTTSPQGLGLATLALLVGAALRNMVVGGAPWAWRSAPLVLPEPRPVAGRPVDVRRPPPQKTPPPRRRGRRNG
jgi:hypothetical protein